MGTEPRKLYFAPPRLLNASLILVLEFRPTVVSDGRIVGLMLVDKLYFNFCHLGISCLLGLP
jgi:hypothetical protein